LITKLLTNILIMNEMEANWDLNLLALPQDRRLSIGVRFGHMIWALNSLNKVMDKIILILGSPYPLIIKFSIKVILTLGLSLSLVLPTHPPFSSKLSKKSTKVKITLQK
jgi:hypothetical protein